jgi:hypothetical protein
VSSRVRLILAAAAIVVAVVVFVIVKPGSNSNAGAKTGNQTVTVTVKNGKIVGGLAHPKLKQGDKVKFIVHADVSDEVHLHGYDIMRNVTPAKPAEIDFTANLPGRFESELEHRKMTIAEFEVVP